MLKVLQDVIYETANVCLAYRWIVVLLANDLVESVIIKDLNKFGETSSLIVQALDSHLDLEFISCFQS